MKVTSVCPDTGALFASLIASGAKVWEVRPSHGAGFKCHVGKWVAVVTSAAQGGQVVAVAKLARILTNAECAAEHGGRGIAQMPENTAFAAGLCCSRAASWGLQQRSSGGPRARRGGARAVPAGWPRRAAGGEPAGG